MKVTHHRAQNGFIDGPISVHVHCEETAYCASQCCCCYFRERLCDRRRSLLSSNRMPRLNLS